VVFPVLDPQLRQRIRDEILGAYLADTAESRFLLPTGEYVRTKNQPGIPRPLFHAQEFLIRLAEDKASVRDIPKDAVSIRPAKASDGASNGVDSTTPQATRAAGQAKPTSNASVTAKKSRTAKRTRERKKTAPSE
jgi:hypothetical protein